MKIYTIIAGVNGVGKSSLSGVLRAERTDLGDIIDTDKIAADSGFTAIEAGKTAIKKIDEYFSKNLSFTQETTLSGRRTEKTIKTAKENGYSIRLFYIGLDTSDESVKRIKNRVEKGGHDIRQDDVERRFSTRFESLAKVLAYCDEVTFYDNENGFAEVARYTNFTLKIKGDYLPKWLTELQETLQKKQQ
ncbi:MAG: zeta toxin family protein [Oscillospiraceae bacterium]|nr:zeta toxin family protein [Oscillospiraceae bacterium]